MSSGNLYFKARRRLYLVRGDDDGEEKRRGLQKQAQHPFVSGDGCSAALWRDINAARVQFIVDQI